MTSEQRDELLLSMNKKILDMDSNIIAMNKRLDKVDSRLDRIDSRLDKVESRLDKVESRLDKVESRLDNMQESIDYIKLMDQQRDEKIAALIDGQKVIFEKLDSIDKTLMSHQEQLDIHEAKINLLMSERVVNQ